PGTTTTTPSRARHDWASSAERSIRDGGCFWRLRRWVSCGASRRPRYCRTAPPWSPSPTRGRVVLLPLSFTGRMRPPSYAGWSLAVFFGQHPIALLLHAIDGQAVAPLLHNWQFYFAPLQMLVRSYGAPPPALLFLALACVLLAAWALAALAFR